MSKMPKQSDIIFYNTPTGNVKIEVIFNDETFWLTQKGMAELFGVEVPAISKHLRNIFESAELDETSVVSKLETTANDGKNYVTAFYSLDAIIAVGYRVNSFQATQFESDFDKEMKRVKSIKKTKYLSLPFSFCFSSALAQIPGFQLSALQSCGVLKSYAVSQCLPHGRVRAI